MQRRIEKIAFLIILLAAFAIRIYSVKACLPYTYWHDENNYIEDALRLGSGTLNMSTFSHGGLYQLILFFGYAGYFIIAKCMNIFSSSSDLFISFLKDPSVFFIIARTIAALCATGVVLLTYLIALKLYDRRTAIVSALFTAFSLIMVQISAVAVADMPAALITLSAFLCLVISVDKPREAKWFFIACLLAGLATACKYNAVFIVSALCVGAFVKYRDCGFSVGHLLRLLTVGAIFTCLGFLSGVPLLIINFGKFVGDSFVRLSGAYIVSNTHPNAWLFYFTSHLRNGLGLPLEVLSLLGISYALYKHSKQDILILAFPISYYLLFMNSVGFAHHMIPAIPFILIAASRLLADLTKKFSEEYAYLICLILGLVIVGPSAADAVKMAGISASPDTRTAARAWVDSNIPAGRSFLMEGYIAGQPVHCPPISANLDTLRADRQEIIARGGSGSVVDMKIKHFDKIYGRDKLYTVYKEDLLKAGDIDKYKPDYIVLTGGKDNEMIEEQPNPEYKNFKNDRRSLRGSISEKYELIKSFAPSYELSPIYPFLIDRDYRVIRKMPLTAIRDYMAGPKIDIYRLKTEAGR